MHFFNCTAFWNLYFFLIEHLETLEEGSKTESEAVIVHENNHRIKT